MTWASTRARSDPILRRVALFLAGIGLPHAEYLSVFPSRRVSHCHKTAPEQPETNHSGFAVVLSSVLDLGRGTLEYLGRIVEIQTPIRQGPRALRWIEGYAHEVIV